MAGDNVSILTVPIASGGTTGTVEIPYAADITDITATTPANVATAALAVAVTKNGTSVFTAPLGQVATLGKTAVGAGAGMAVGDTTMYMTFALLTAPVNAKGDAEPIGEGNPDIQVGAILTIGTEQLLVTGQVLGSAQVDGATGNPVYAVPVTRGYNSTTAAAHAAGASILPTAPTIAVGSKESSLGCNPIIGSTPLLAEGDVLTVTLSGSYTATAAEVTIEIEQR